MAANLENGVVVHPLGEVEHKTKNQFKVGDIVKYITKGSPNTDKNFTIRIITQNVFGTKEYALFDSMSVPFVHALDQDLEIVSEYKPFGFGAMQVPTQPSVLESHGYMLEPSSSSLPAIVNGITTRDIGKNGKFILDRAELEHIAANQSTRTSILSLGEYERIMGRLSTGDTTEAKKMEDHVNELADSHFKERIHPDDNLSDHCDTISDNLMDSHKAPIVYNGMLYQQINGIAANMFPIVRLHIFVISNEYAMKLVASADKWSSEPLFFVPKLIQRFVSDLIVFVYNQKRHFSGTGKLAIRMESDLNFLFSMRFTHVLNFAAFNLGWMYKQDPHLKQGYFSISDLYPVLSQFSGTQFPNAYYAERMKSDRTSVDSVNLFLNDYTSNLLAFRLKSEIENNYKPGSHGQIICNVKVDPSFSQKAVELFKIQSAKEGWIVGHEKNLIALVGVRCKHEKPEPKNMLAPPMIRTSSSGSQLDYTPSASPSVSPSSSMSP